MLSYYVKYKKCCYCVKYQKESAVIVWNIKNKMPLLIGQAMQVHNQ